MMAELEISTLTDTKVEDDDYLNAVTGEGTYSSAPHQQSGGVANIGYDKISSTNNALSEPMVKSAIAGASVNLVNSIVGAGIIGIPHAFMQSILIAGVLLLILVAFLTDKSLRIIVGLASFHPLL